MFMVALQSNYFVLLCFIFRLNLLRCDMVCKHHSVFGENWNEKEYYGKDRDLADKETIETKQDCHEFNVSNNI